MYILSAADVQQAVSMAAAIDAVAVAFAQLSSGDAIVPLRTHIDVTAQDADSFFMPAYLPPSSADAGGLGLKVVSVFPHNQERETLPSIHAAVIVLDPDTGVPIALLDGTYLTALRTGASSGVATRLLARPNSEVLAIFGAGGQAFHQVLAVCTARSIKRVWIVNRSRERAEAFCERLRTAGAPIPDDILLADTPAQAMSEADVVCCATSSPAPLFADEDVRPGTHINGVGAYNPTLAEIPPATLARALLMVDQRSAAWAEAGDLIQARNLGVIAERHVAAELGELVAGRVEGRTDNEQITCFKSVGNAVQDLAVARIAVQQAQALGLGTQVRL